MQLVSKQLYELDSGLHLLKMLTSMFCLSVGIFPSEVCTSYEQVDLVFNLVSWSASFIFIYLLFILTKVFAI